MSINQNTSTYSTLAISLQLHQLQKQLINVAHTTYNFINVLTTIRANNNQFHHNLQLRNLLTTSIPANNNDNSTETTQHNFITCKFIIYGKYVIYSILLTHKNVIIIYNYNLT